MADLDLPLSEEQALLRDAVHRLVNDLGRPGWDDLSGQLGLGGLTLSEAQGGFGGGIIDIALVMAELGPALAGADWLSHAVACRVLAQATGHPAPQHTTLAELASGTRRAALICAASAAAVPHVGPDGLIGGSARLVCGGADADLLVIAGEGGFRLVTADAPGLTRESTAMHDGSVTADLHFDAVASTPLPGAPATADAWVRAGRCAEAVGLMQRMLADTADYINQRKQFGAAIGSFQALRHRFADMTLAALQAQALTEAAVSAVDADAADQAEALAAACLLMRSAARTVGEGAVQLHGAMGLTEELELGARFKRLLAICSALGSEAALTERLTAAL